MSARRPATANAKPAEPSQSDEQLERRLKEKEAQLSCATDQLERHKATQAQVHSEQATAAAQLSAERTQFGELSAFLKHSLAEQTARADGLQQSLADALARLEAVQTEAAAAAAAAEERRVAETAAAQAVLDGQLERVQQADAFLAERDQLAQRAQELEAQLEEERRQHHKLQMDGERKHAADRELWRREMAEAVRQAREEAAALTEQRLDATTRQRVIENEDMAGELQYQGRHLSALLARNSALQKEVAELRVQLSIGRRNEEELAKKALACQLTAESLVARIKALEAQRAADAEGAEQLAAQLEAAREEARAMELHASAQACRAEELQAGLEAKTREMQRMQTEREDSATFLLACLADTRQQLLAQQGLAELAGTPQLGAAAAAAGGLGAISEQVQEEGKGGAKCAEAGTSSLSCAESKAALQTVQLAELSLKERQAVLLRLLEQLGVDWRAREGLLLPVSSCNSRPLGLDGSGAAQLTAEQGVPHKQVAVPTSVSSSPSPAPSKGLPSTSSVQSSSSDGMCSRSELLELLLSDVRPWGRSLSSGTAAGAAGGSSPAGRRLGSVAYGGGR